MFGELKNQLKRRALTAEIVAAVLGCNEDQVGNYLSTAFKAWMKEPKHWVYPSGNRKLQGAVITAFVGSLASLAELAGFTVLPLTRNVGQRTSTINRIREACNSINEGNLFD